MAEAIDATPYGRGTPQNTQVVRGAALTALVFAATLFGGARAFGGDALPNVLNNYEADSLGATVARLGTGVARRHASEGGRLAPRAVDGVGRAPCHSPCQP